MQIPLLVGYKLNDVADILSKYPFIKWDVVKYQSPKDKKGELKEGRVERVVRQRFICTNRIELVVSYFFENPIVS